MVEALVYQATVSTPIGKIGVRTSDKCLLGIDYLGEDDLVVKPKTMIAKETIEQVLCYFADPEFSFEIPFNLNVTPFQEKVLQALRAIPVGRTQTYKELAQKLGTKPRPVGNACRRNPIPIVIPCHRIVSSTSMSGYNGVIKGPFLEIKRWLLHHEGECILTT
ncbi:MAG: methylated-DNA--[protein]-cysteine S-methyltransferase [Coxiella endosymbiont of Haemaphysalis qinghaiensis]